MRVAVVGGGIAGLAAAWELSGTPDTEVTVLEPGPPGGRIQTTEFEGHRVDCGADAFIARVPDARDLAAELGLEGELVAPQATKALLLVGGRLRPLPDGLVLGAPARLRPLMASGILSPRGLARAGLDLVLPRSNWPDDPTVAALITGRFGRQVTQRLVDPLVGGIHAGRTEALSAESTAPQLATAARSHRSLLLGLRALAPSGREGPLFLAPRQGMGHLIDRLVDALTARGVRLDPTAATALGPAGKGSSVHVDPVGLFDAAVLATPPAVTARVLKEAAPEAAEGLAGIRTASVALATLAYRRNEVSLPGGVSGWLVARSEGSIMTACSIGSAKWPHWSDPGTVVLRVSAGRDGDERAMAMTDETLIDRLQREVAGSLGTAATPFAWRASRWPGSFPQYEPGHRARIERVESELRRTLPGVALAGSSLRGSGIPACIASGRRAARLVTASAGAT